MSRGTTFGNCKEHGDYCGKTCPFCQIDELKKYFKDMVDIDSDNQQRIITLEKILRELWRRFFMHVDLGHKDLVMMGRDYIEKLDVDKTEKKEGLPSYPNCDGCKTVYLKKDDGSIICDARCKASGDKTVKKVCFKCPICQSKISNETEFECPICKSEVLLREIGASGGER